MKNRDATITIILFYLGWFGCVFIAKTSLSIVSLVFPLVLASFLYMRRSIGRGSTIFALTLSLLGVLFDLSLIHLGFVTVYGNPGFIVPVWLVSIWLLFSFSVVKLGPIIDLPIWLSSFLGMIVGPLSYKSGELFEVLRFSSSATFAIYACFWGIVFPLVLSLLKKRSI